MPRLGSRVRVSFSAQRTKDSIRLSFFLCVSRNFRDYIDNPSKPPFDKGGFAWSRKRDSPRSDPKLPPTRGFGGVDNRSREMPANAGSWLVFRSKSKSFEDKIKQNPLKHRFRGFFICCRSVSLRLRGAPTRHRPNLEVSLRISTVKIRDTYSETRGHFDNLGQKNQLLANFSPGSCLRFIKKQSDEKYIQNPILRKVGGKRRGKDAPNLCSHYNQRHKGSFQP